MPRLAWFSPLSESAVLRSSALTASFLRHCPADWEIELFVDDRELNNRRAAEFLGRPVRHHLTAALHDAARPFDYFIFQVEDHPAAEYTRTCMGLWPGLAFFHDLHFSESAAEIRNRAARTTRSAEASAGDAAYDPGELFRSAQLAAAFDVRGFHALQKHTREVSPVVLPFMLEPPIKDSSTRAASDSSEGQFILGYAGRFSVEDRMHLVLRLFNELVSKPAKLIWMIADDFAYAEAQRAVSAFSSKQAREHIVFRRPHSREELRLEMSCLDLFLGLKFDALRALPLPLLTALECGVPALVSNFGASAELAEGCALRVDVGNREYQMLGELVRRLAADEILRAELGRSAHEFTEVSGDPRLWINDLTLLLAEHGPVLREALKRRRKLYAERETELEARVHAAHREALSRLLGHADEARGSTGEGCRV